MLRGAGEPSGLGGGDRGAGVGGREAEAVTKGVEVEGDDHGGGVAAVQREPVGVDGLEQGGEGVAEGLAVGQSLGLMVVASRRGEGVQVGQQPVGGGVGDPDRDVGGTVSAAVGGQAGVAVGGSFLGFEGAPFVGLAELGGDDVEDPAAQDPQVKGCERGCLGHEPGLGQGSDGVGDVGGQGVERPGDHAGLVEVDVALGESAGQDRPTVVEGVGQPSRSGGGRSVEAGVVGQPGRDVAGPVGCGHVVGGRDDAQS